MFKISLISLEMSIEKKNIIKHLKKMGCIIEYDWVHIYIQHNENFNEVSKYLLQEGIPYEVI